MQFLYDGDGNLVKKINPNNSRTIYVGGLYEVNKNAGGTVTGTTTYYPAGGAMRVNGTLYYMLKDHLGSASVVTGSTGNIVGEQRYYPFGETRLATGTLYTDKLFTGQRNIAGLGIYHYQSEISRSAPEAERRGYSLKLGRFLSADSLVPNPFNPQDYNRYFKTITRLAACHVLLVPYGDSNNIPPVGTTVVKQKSRNSGILSGCAPTGIRITSPLWGRRS